MKSSSLVYHSLWLIALTIARANASTPSITKRCVELQVPISVIATNHYYNHTPRFDSTIDAVQWAVNFTTWSTNTSNTGTFQVNCTVHIDAQLCFPAQLYAKASILHIATQGLGFDKRLWDVQVDVGPDGEAYSYLDAAIHKGYSVLTYDRLKTGKSDKPNAYDIVQIPTEVEIIAGLTKLVRSGKLISSSKLLAATNNNIASTDYQPSKIVHVAHSFVAAVTAGMLGSYGNLSDAALLTGFLINPHLGSIDVSRFNHDYAREYDPGRYAEYGSGYFVLASKDDLQKLFFREGGFDRKLFDYNDQIKQPEAVGEYVSQANFGLNKPAVGFKGPVLSLVGEFDYFICAGDCRNQYDEAATKMLFPEASDWSHYLQPNTGHVLNLAKNASAGYEIMFKYLNDHGL